ncbi:MAG TPA: alpha/beta hydrolase [Capillimicrobium sp.]|nr:alpha/beta hydrolase [Capillimicrobium sp.]
MLVHGVIVSSRYFLPLGAQLAAAGLPVVVPDLPGFGHSDRPASAPSPAALADAVVAAARACGHERVALVGNSFGAQVAVEAARRHPDAVARLALLGPTVDPATRPLARLFVRWLRNAPDEHPSSVALMARDLVDIGARRAAAMVREMVADRIEERLPDVACPVLVVRGARDRVASPAWCARVLRLAGGRGEVVELSGGAHMAHYARAIEMAAALRPFLAAPDAAGAR